MRSPDTEALVRQLNDEQDEIREALAQLDATGSRFRALTLITDCLPLSWDLGHIKRGLFPDYRGTGRLPV